MNGSVKKGICHIVGAADFAVDRFIVDEGDFVIAADAGLKWLENIGHKPDMILAWIYSRRRRGAFASRA